LAVYLGGEARRGFGGMAQMGRMLGGWGLLFWPLGLLQHAVYRWVARNRRRFMGRADLCGLPDPAVRSRLLP